MSATILIVEDETDLAASCARLLRCRGWHVETAAIRDAALAAVEGAHRPALAIVDRQLPDGDGLDVVRAAHGTGTPVIVVTGFTSAAARRRALAEGAAGSSASRSPPGRCSSSCPRSSASRARRPTDTAG
jgi:DNA-binding response OmpR family regulator